MSEALPFESGVTPPFDVPAQAGRLALVPEQLISQLTPRELEELDFGSRGHAISQLAVIRYRSSETIKFHRANIFDKLQANNFVHAVRRGYELELFTTRLDINKDALDALTLMQMKELELASLGYSMREAMASRHRSMGTIRAGRSEVLRKLNANMMAYAVRIAIEAEILPINRRSATSSTTEMP